jgi:putative membrane protein
MQALATFGTASDWEELFPAQPLLRSQTMEIAMKSHILIAGAAALIMVAGGANAQDKGSQKFLTEAIEGNYAEVEMGKLAQSNGQSDSVKSFGQMLVNDHGAANQKANQAAQSMTVNPPSGPNRKQQADYDKMAKLKGDSFDRMFAQHMVTDHKKDIAAYQKASKKKDAAGQYAQESLPILQKHLETAQALGKKR